MMCDIIPFYLDSCIPIQKPDWKELLDQLKFLGFELPLGVTMRIMSGNYEGFSLNGAKDEFVFHTHGYNPITIYKTNFTSANTLFKI